MNIDHNLTPTEKDVCHNVLNRYVLHTPIRTRQRNNLPTSWYIVTRVKRSKQNNQSAIYYDSSSYFWMKTFVQMFVHKEEVFFMDVEQSKKLSCLETR